MDYPDWNKLCFANRFDRRVKPAKMEGDRVSENSGAYYVS